jgi:hypothetical protein
MVTWKTVVIVVIYGLAGVTHSFGQANVGVGSATVRSIDVEDLLAQNLGIDRTPRRKEDSDCPGGGGGGFRAKRFCQWVRQFRDLSVEKIVTVTVGALDVAAIPSRREDKELGFENTWTHDPYSFEETAEYETQQQVVVDLKEVLTKVSDFTSDIALNATVFKSVGIKSEEKSGDSVTFSTTKSSTRPMDEKFKISSKIKFDVPPCTHRWAKYSDIKKDASIPVEIVGVLKGRVVDFVPGYNYEGTILDLQSSVPPEKRTFKLTGNVELLGSDRSLHVVLGEEPITTGSCARGRQ